MKFKYFQDLSLLSHLFFCLFFSFHPFSHTTYSTSSIVVVGVLVSRCVRESDKLLGGARANRSLYILIKISIFFIANISEILFA